MTVTLRGKEGEPTVADYRIISKRDGNTVGSTVVPVVVLEQEISDELPFPGRYTAAYPSSENDIVVTTREGFEVVGTAIITGESINALKIESDDGRRFGWRLTLEGDYPKPTRGKTVSVVKEHAVYQVS